MSWVRLDDGFHSNPKVRKAGNVGAGVYARALSWCGAYHTDGFISRKDAALIGKTAELRKVTEAELWEEIEPGDTRTVTGRRDSGNRPLPDVTLVFDCYGFFISDFLHSNSTKAEVEEARAKRSAAGAKGGAATQADAKADAQANASADAQAPVKHSPKHTPAQPVPVTERTGFSVDAAATTLADAVIDRDDGTARVFAKELGELARVERSFVAGLAEACTSTGRGAGWVVNAIRLERVRQLTAGLLREVDAA